MCLGMMSSKAASPVVGTATSSLFNNGNRLDPIQKETKKTNTEDTPVTTTKNKTTTNAPTMSSGLNIPN